MRGGTIGREGKRQDVRKAVSPVETNVELFVVATLEEGAIGKPLLE